MLISIPPAFRLARAISSSMVLQAENPAIFGWASPGSNVTAVTSDGEPINILSLNEKVCKWPIGEPGDDDFRFCGNRKENGSPYCAEHTRVAYQPLEKKKKKNKLLNKRMPASKINNF